MAQVEKEIKFSPEPDTLRRLITGTGQEMRNRDVYYGFPEIQGVKYPLIKQNAWLRKRNDEYELKIVTEGNRNGGLKVSKEIPRGQVEGTLEDLLDNQKVDRAGLEDHRLEPLVYVATNRRRYTEEAKTQGVEEFNVDLDHVRFWQEMERGWARAGDPDMTWVVGEIDITAGEQQPAKTEINRVVSKYDLDVHRKRKVVTYFRETDSDIFEYIPDG